MIYSSPARTHVTQADISITAVQAHTYITRLVVELDCPFERGARGDGREIIHPRKHGAIVANVEAREVPVQLLNVVRCHPDSRMLAT